MGGRQLTSGETVLAHAVFGEAIVLERVRLHDGGFGRFAVTLGSWIMLPKPLQRPDFCRADPVDQALLVHELVHVWQFQTRALRTLASWAKTVATGGYGPGLPAYRYSLPLAPFDRLGLERQASIVEHLFLLKQGYRATSTPPQARISDLQAIAPFPMQITPDAAR